MIRALLFCLALLVTLSAAPAFAQPPPATSAISAEQARQALDVLKDAKKRAAFIATLETIAKAQPAAPAGKAGAKPAETPAPPAAAEAPASTGQVLPIPLAPDSLGAQVLVTASEFVNHLGTQAREAMDTVQSLPLLWGWVVVMATTAWARDMLLDAGWRLALALIGSLAVAYGLRHLMRRPILRLEALAPRPASREEPVPVPESPPQPAEPGEDATARAEAGEVESPPTIRRRPSAIHLMRVVPFVMGRLVLELVPVLGLLVVGHLVAGSLIGGMMVSRLVILAVIDATALCMALLSMARMLLSPATPKLRLLHLRNSVAAYLMRWTRRLVLLAVFGYVIGEVALLFGMSPPAHNALQKAVGLALCLCISLIVLQKRRAVRRRLRAPEDSTGLWAALRNRFAAIWHWLALFVLIGGWLVWTVEVRNGFPQVLLWLLLTITVLVVSRLLLVVLLGSLDRSLRLSPEGAARHPEMESRLRMYHPVAATLLRGLVFFVAVLALLQIYGLGVAAWLFAEPLGQRVLSGLATMLVTILLALAVWEVVNLAFQRHLAKLQREAQTARSARLRTLLPLLRTSLLITILVVAGLMVLSEIGLNIAPLLAGAGIVGVAIGFGSQKLVQDLITGIFLLLENAMQVGDVVKVSDHAGVVEGLSVRTIRLRSEDGSVHVIPFSSVTTVTNMTKDYSRAVIQAGVAYKEDYDRVVDVLKEIAREMRAETAWKAIILDDLEVWGLDQLADSSVVIKCRIMCTPFGRWSVQRDFNRRMKKRFDELGIEIPFPHRKLVIEGALPVAMPPQAAAGPALPAPAGSEVPAA